jgi:HEAT repeat protein
LVQALQDNDPKVRFHAAYKLFYQRPAAKAAAAALTKALEDPDPCVRRQAALSLGCLGPEGKAAVSLLIKILEDQSRPFGSARTEAAAALGHM